MITLFVFYLHTVAAVRAFTKRWQESGWGEGMLSVGFIVLIFSVGWSIAAFILGLFMEKKGFGIWLDRDAMSLLLLTIIETGVYYLMVKKKKKAATTATHFCA